MITAEDQMNRDKAIVSARLFELYIKDVLSMTRHPPPARRGISEKPTASMVTRLQASQQSWTTNLLHEPIAVDIVTRHLLPMLDGEHDRKMIRDRMLDLIKNKTLVMQEDGVPLEDNQAISEKLDAQLDAYIENAAQRGFLMN